MTAPWSRVEKIYHAALSIPPGERSTFVETACADDPELRQEVESLLSYEEDAGGFLERPALEHAAAGWPDEHNAPSPGQQIAGYEIVSLLGAGGMGEVYRASDLRLERDVALKVLAHGISGDPGYLRRFEEEARSASVLNHPNIVTIYGVGEDNDVAYIAMELVQGQTLRAVLSGDAMPVRTAIALGVQLATALAAAHGAGIVHRDLKPENIMVTPDGLLKVLDFGIAKRTRAVTAPAIVPALVHTARDGTQAGLILGTAGYMSPEQAAGAPVTFASDHFSFGAILYEMLSGRRAFERSTKAATLDAIMREPHLPIQTLDLPGHERLKTVLDRCLAKTPSDRYGDSRTLAAELTAIEEALRIGTPARVMTRRRALELGAAATLATAAGAYVWRASRGDPGIRSLAVLPFTTTGHDDEAQDICDGVTESLIRRLSPAESLRVMARSTVFNFKGKGIDPLTAGRQLGVDAVLTGRIRRQDGLLQISAELVDVRTGAQLWSRSYDRGAADLMTVEEEIAIAIIDQGIRLPLTSEERRQLVRTPTDDPNAYAVYLQGMRLQRRGTEEDYLGARALFTEAVAIDTHFTLAYVSLASTFTEMAIDGFEKPADASQRWRNYITTALALDRSLPEAHAEHAAGLFMFQHQWAEAEREWRRALEYRDGQLLPDLVGAFVIALWALGRGAEGIRFARAARRLDHLSPQFAILEADLQLSAGALDAATPLYLEAIAGMPNDARPHFGLAEVFRQQKRFDDAIAERSKAHRAAGDLALADVLASARGEEGYDRIEHAAVLLELAGLTARRESGAYVSPLDAARAHSRAHQPDEAFASLARAFDEQSPALVFLNVDRAWDPIRSDPRFAPQVRRMNFPSS